MSESVRLATRRSRLATVQTRLVLQRLRLQEPSTHFVPVPIDTSGDKDRRPGSSPDFTDAIDRAVLRGEVDLAVHSAKDLPVELDRHLGIWACPRRADPRDCLVVGPGRNATALPRGARIGSSSPRRRAQLLRWRPDLRVTEIRGNVDTRIEKVRGGSLDAIVLAAAGLARLRRRKEIGRYLSIDRFLPAPAQGALAVVGRHGDRALARLARKIDDPSTHACVDAEREVARTLEGDCRLPLGALARGRGAGLLLRAEVLSLDGRTSLRASAEGSLDRPQAVGARVGHALLALGADRLFRRSMV